MPTAIRAPAGDGASRYASGFHVCIGANPALVPYPINANTTPIRSVNGCSVSARSMNRVQCRPDNPSPSCPCADAKIRTVPSRANPRPRLPNIRNFHAASSDVSWLWNATRNTEASVVNSTAIHRMPRLFDTATSSIAKT